MIVMVMTILVIMFTFIYDDDVKIYDHNSGKAVAGSLTRISAGMAGVWGLNAANQVHDVTIIIINIISIAVCRVAIVCQLTLDIKIKLHKNIVIIRNISLSFVIIS